MMPQVYNHIDNTFWSFWHFFGNATPYTCTVAQIINNNFKLSIFFYKKNPSNSQWEVFPQLNHVNKSYSHTRLLHPTANPIAVLSNPSIPLAPLLPTTHNPWHGTSQLDILDAELIVDFTQPRPYMSASRMTMLFPINKATSLANASDITCTTWGSVSEYSEWIWKDTSHAT